MATTLYTAPGTCGRVAAIALSEAGIPFDGALIRFMRGEHKSPPHIARNPLGKVPVLEIDGTTLTENVAIVGYLNRRNPEARLMPPADDLIAQAKQLADLCFCSSTLHPVVTRIRMPTLFVEGDDAVAGIYARATMAMQPYFEVVERRLDAGLWWYGADWSAVDAYLYWVWFRVTGAGFDPSAFPNYAAHAERMADRPAVREALALEERLEAQLASEGLSFVPPRVAVR